MRLHSVPQHSSEFLNVDKNVFIVLCYLSCLKGQLVFLAFIPYQIEIKRIILVILQVPGFFTKRSVLPQTFTKSCESFTLFYHDSKCVIYVTGSAKTGHNCIFVKSLFIKYL